LDPALALPEVMSLCGVKKIVSGWRNPNAHLDRLDWLLDQAAKFREECRGLGLCASITGFLRYMALLRESGEDKSEGDSGGVQVCTWHRSKGLEWPITIIQDWDKPVEPLRNMLGVLVYQTSAMDPDSPLANRELLFILSPFQPKWNSAFHDHLRGTQIYRLCESRAMDERIRLLYTLYTRARDKLIFFGPTRQAQVSAGPLVINSLSPEGAPGWDVRTRQHSGMGHSLPRMQRIAWFTYGDAPPEGRLAVVSPSQGTEEAAHIVEATLTLALDLGKGLELNSAPVDKRNIGNALHGYFAVNRQNLDGAAKRELARRLVQGWGLNGVLNPGKLAEYADAWDAGSAEFFKGASIQREVPLALQWGDVLLRGEADWLAETGSEIAIVDHKSYQGNRSDAEKEALRHAPQLAAYAAAVEKSAGKPVRHTYIHFPAMGWLMEVEMNGETRRRLVERLLGTENS
jgi:ATP-dependent exoDNAse (exonuclease V) beta subunit